MVMGKDGKGGPPIKKIVEIPLKFEEIDKRVNDLGKDFVDTCFGKDFNGRPDVTVTQIRKFLSAVNMIQNKLSADEKKFDPGEIQYLRIKLAYQKGRQGKKLEMMQEKLDPVIARIHNAKDFKVFARLIEAIVAYHKFYGGSN